MFLRFVSEFALLANPIVAGYPQPQRPYEFCKMVLPLIPAPFGGQ